MFGNRLVAAATVAALAAGCATGGGPFTGGEHVNYAAGSALGRDLGPRETDALYAVFLTAVERGPAGDPQPWSAGSHSGTVTPGAYLVGNLKPNPATLLPVEGRLDLNESYETELGLHALTRNANVRSGPSADARVLTMFDSGTGVDVVGRTVGKPWMLVAADGMIRGYIHESLMVKAPGLELELAGGPTRRAHFCREFTQSIALFGQTDRWQGVACDRGEGWRLEPPPEQAPAQF